MYEDFFADRISKLRLIKDVSAREMSLSIGQNKNYINHIENKKMFPSIQGFFYICEYLDITPKEFFDEENTAPTILNELIEELKPLKKDALEYLLGFVRETKKK